MTRWHPFKISLDRLHDAWQYAFVAHKCIAYAIRIPLDTRVSFHSTEWTQSIVAGLTILSNAMVFELLSSEYPNDSSSVERCWYE